MGKVALQLIRVLALAVTLTGVSQAIRAQEAVLPGGNFHSNGTSSISWSLGEAVIQTLRSADNIITQGFQQSRLTVTSVKEIPGLKMIISAFPNPTNSYINLKVDGEIENLTFAVYDISGRVVTQGKMESNPTQVSFDQQSAGVYFIRVLKDNHEVRIFRIVKQ